MPDDPIVRLGHLRIIKASHDIEQAFRGRGSPADLETLRILRERAADALAALAFVDPEKPNEIRTLQNEVKRYDEHICAWRDILSQGRTYAQNMDEEAHEEMLDILTQTAEGQREAEELGLVDLGPGDA